MPDLPTLSQWVRALAETSAAMLLCLIAGGLLFSPGRAEQERARIPQIRGKAILVPQRNAFFALVETPGRQQTSKQLAEWKVLWGDSARQPNLLRTNNPLTFAADPDGSRVFVGDVHGNIHVILLESEREFLVGRVAKGAAVSMNCTLDGKSLVVQDPNGLVAWDVDLESSGYATPRWYHLDPFVECFALYPHEEAGIKVRSQDAAADGTKANELFEFDFFNGKQGEKIGEAADRVVTVVISPDGRWMAAVQASCEIQLFRRSAVGMPWQIERIDGLTSGLSMVVCFSSDSQLLVTSSNQCNGLVVWELAGPKVQMRTQPLTSAIVNSEFLDDTHFLSWSKDAKLYIWEVQHSSPQLEIELTLK